MIRRACCGSQAGDLLAQELKQALFFQNCFRLLIEEGLVGATATLRHEQELIAVALGQRNVDLGGQVGSRIDFVPHRGGRHLGVTQVEVVIGLGNTVRDVFGIATIGQDAVATLGHDQGGSGVLTHGENATRSNVGVLEQIKSNVLVVAGRLGVIQDGAQLGKVCGAKEVVDFLVGGVGKELECFRRNRSESVLAKCDGFNTFVAEQSPVVVRRLTVQDLVFALVHDCLFVLGK